MANVEGMWQGWQSYVIELGKLREAMQEFPDDSLIFINRVGNLNVYTSFNDGAEWIGFFNFTDGTFEEI